MQHLLQCNITHPNDDVKHLLSLFSAAEGLDNLMNTMTYGYYRCHRR